MIIVGGIIKNEDNKYLVIKEKKEKYYGMYNIPAGHLEENELLFDGLKREVKEETGYDVNIKGLVQIGNTKEFVSFIFLCDLSSEQGAYFKDEIMSVEWLSYDEIVNNSHNFRSPDLVIDAINNVEKGKICPLDLIK